MNTISLSAEHNDYARYGFLTKTYGWMCLALLISAVSAFLGATSPALLSFLFSNHALGVKVLAIVEIGIVIFMTMTIQTMPLWTAITSFILYSVVNGLTLSSIFLIFNIQSIMFVFFSAALMFGGMSLYGMLTKKNLASVGHYFMLALLGLVVVSGVNMLVTFITHISLGWVDWLISFATVIIFSALTAYDVQKIMRTAQRADDSEAYQKIALLAALELYLDFINIFLSLLRMFGKKRN